MYDWQIPAWLLKSEFAQRYGIDSYKHPEILDALSDLAPETHFEQVLDETFTQSELQELSSREIERKIRAKFEDRRYEVDKLFKGNQSCAKWLGRLAKKRPQRVQPIRTHHGREWRISPRPPQPAGEEPM